MPRTLRLFRRPGRRGPAPSTAKLARFEAVVEAWLRADVTLKVRVIHERLVAEHGFTGHYQRVKVFCAEARPRILAELIVIDLCRARDYAEGLTAALAAA